MKYDSIAILVKIASLEFDKVSNQILSPYELSNSQFKILKYILWQEAGAVRQIDIENYFAMTNPTVTGLVQNMEKKGLVERVPNPEDKRSKLIRVTDKVRAIEPELMSLGSKLEESFTKNLNEEEKQQMKILLRKMIGE